MAAQLQAGVTFEQVIQQDPVRYDALSPEKKSELANDFFAKNVQTQPGFDQLEPEKQAEVQQDFLLKYEIQVRCLQLHDKLHQSLFDQA
jgi:hypothetical protein